ncbi:pseudouridine synthase [Pontibacter harenae]|uniref:pseudouridine synthase n=1 Tax=Pontibacter harenae TaxID=2894083 RepID=UPI00272A24A2|nr:pseudouridine synthase [Pontibacter harenae]
MARDNERPDRDSEGTGRRGSDRSSSDRPNNDRGEKKIFNRRDKAEGREGGERRSFGGEKRSFGGDRREGGEKRSFGSDRRESGERRSFNSDRREGGERRSFGGDRREGGEKRSFNSDRPNREGREGGERRSFGGDRREGGERRSFGGDRENRSFTPRREEGDRKPFNRDRREDGGEHRSFNTDRREGGDRKPYGDRREGGEKRNFGNDRSKRPEREGGEERHSFNSERGDNRFGSDRRDDRRESGERRSFGGEKRSFGNDRREDGERRSFNSDRREGGERRSFGGDRREGGERKSFGGDREKRSFSPKREEGDKKSFGSGDRRGRFNDGERTQEAPSYNLSRYDNNPRIKKSNIKDKDDDGTIRLNRYIANAGVCSRREADSLIESGEIKVNGEVITEMGYKVKPSDTIQYGKKILNREKLVYVLLNKPKDFITTTEDPEGRKTVMSLVEKASSERIFPVGRLDRNTTGLLLFTNDGELAQKLTHPSNDVRKIYQVELDKPITKEDFAKVAEGVELEDGKAEVDDVAMLGDTKKFLGLEIHIGRNRIVRRIFEHLGYEVVTLDRVQYAGLTKKDLPRGNWRYLTEKEVVRLKYFM